MVRLDGFTPITRPSLSGLVDIRADYLKTDYANIKTLKMTGGLTGATYVSTANLYFSGSCVGPTGAFTDLSATNSHLTSLTGTNLYETYIHNNSMTGTTIYETNINYTGSLVGPTGIFTNVSTVSDVVVGGMLVSPQITSTTNNAVGPRNLLNGTNNGSTTAVGSFIKTSGWTTANSSHTITYNNLIYNNSNDNWAGFLYVFASNKASNTPKDGSIEAVVNKVANANTYVSSLHTTKNGSLSTLSITNSSTDVVVSTDSDCCISWVLIGAV